MVPNLRLISILNPFLCIVPFFISLILKLFLDVTTNKDITSIVNTGIDSF